MPLIYTSIPRVVINEEVQQVYATCNRQSQMNIFYTLVKQKVYYVALYRHTKELRFCVEG